MGFVVSLQMQLLFRLICLFFFLIIIISWINYLLYAYVMERLFSVT